MKKLIFALFVLLGVAWWVSRPSLPEPEVVTAKPECDSCKEPKKIVEKPSVIRGRTPMEAAETFLQTIPVQEHHELRPTIYRSPLGASVSYEVLQDGVPIVGLGIRLRMNRNFEVVEIENEYRPLPKADTSPRLSAEEVASTASTRYDFSSNHESRAHAGKILFARADDRTPELAWAVPMTCGKRQCSVVLRASDGQLLARTFARTEFGH